MSVGLPDLAKKAGLSPVQCRKCGAHLETRQALDELFVQIVEAVKEGEEVRIIGFGKFRGIIIKGKTIETPVVEGGKATFPDTLVLKFSQSRKVKERLNPRD